MTPTPSPNFAYLAQRAAAKFGGSSSPASRSRHS